MTDITYPRVLADIAELATLPPCTIVQSTEIDDDGDGWVIRQHSYFELTTPQL